MNSRRLRPPQENEGFTLIEVLVASTIFLLLAVLLASVVEGVGRVSSQASTRLEVERISREAFDLIGRDIAIASLPWSRSATNSLQFISNPDGLAGELCQPHSIFWQAPLAHGGAATNGNLAIVGYCVLSDLQANGSQSRFQLRRVFISPEVAGASSNYLIYDKPNEWITPTIVREFAPQSAQTDKDDAYKGWIADGVLAMWVRCLDRTGNPIVLNAAGSTAGYHFDSRAGYRSDGINRYPSGYLTLPPFVEIALVCVAPTDVLRIVSLPPTGATSPSSFELETNAFADAVRQANPGVKSLRVFTRKFRIYGGY
ncbi:MAG: prepilin-type N-terminal cleavage/methylation domain-containing protein [Chthoniobacterales bacterium]